MIKLAIADHCRTQSVALSDLEARHILRDLVEGILGREEGLPGGLQCAALMHASMVHASHTGGCRSTPSATARWSPPKVICLGVLRVLLEFDHVPALLCR